MSVQVEGKCTSKVWNSESFWTSWSCRMLSPAEASAWVWEPAAHLPWAAHLLVVGAAPGTWAEIRKGCALPVRLVVPWSPEIQILLEAADSDMLATWDTSWWLSYPFSLGLKDGKSDQCEQLSLFDQALRNTRGCLLNLPG